MGSTLAKAEAGGGGRALVGGGPDGGSPYANGPPSFDPAFSCTGDSVGPLVCTLDAAELSQVCADEDVLESDCRGNTDFASSSKAWLSSMKSLVISSRRRSSSSMSSPSPSPRKFSPRKLSPACSCPCTRAWAPAAAIAASRVLSGLAVNVLADILSSATESRSPS